MTPKLTYEWWDKHRDKTLPKTGLGAALKAYEAANKKANDKCSADVLQEALDKLNNVKTTANAAVSKCKKVVHAGMKDTLKKYSTVVDQEAKSLSAEIEKTRSTVKLLKNLQKTYRPKCEKAWKDFDALFKETEKTLKQAEAKKGSPDDVKRWVKLADSAEGLANKYKEECRKGQSEVNKIVLASSNHVKDGHGEEVAQVFSSLGKLIVAIDNKMGNLKGNVRKLRDTLMSQPGGEMKLQRISFKLNGSEMATAASGTWDGKELKAKMQWGRRAEPIDYLQKKFAVTASNADFDKTLKFNGWTYGSPNTTSVGTGKFVP